METYAEMEGKEGRAREDEEAQLARTAVHDREAFLTLYDRYVVVIERYVTVRGGSSDVEDMVSITFSRALARIESFHPERGSFAAWLFAIARNAVADHYRESARSTHYEPGLLAPAPQLGPEAAAIANEDAQWMWAALEALTPDQRDALALRYAGDLPFAVVAHILGKSTPAAKMLVQRGLHALRRYYERDQAHD
ncbi:MAG: RNA polymerase sigma factor [Chloroflexota bacterium]